MDEKAAERIAKARGKNASSQTGETPSVAGEGNAGLILNQFQDDFTKRAGMAARNNRDRTGSNIDAPWRKEDPNKKKSGGEQVKS